MKKLLLYISLFVFFSACSRGKKVPDVSGIKVDLPVLRFEQDFFAIDTTNINASLQRLHEKYPAFLQDFIFNILALPPQPDSSRAVEDGVRAFITSYKTIKENADKIFSNIDAVENETRQGLRFVKYYFPDYKLPSKLVTFVGPLNSYGNIITPDALGVGLQLYMGRSYPVYLSEAGHGLYPAYVSRRFEAEYIPANCIKTIIDDMYPNSGAGRPLIEQMVEAGKRLYLLDQLMPSTADTLKTGYTEKQLKGCFENESNIWGLFLQNDLLYSTDPSVIKDYMNDGPKTPVLGEDSPGFIGQFVGWQIIKKWMDKNDKTSLDELMKTDPKKIFGEAKYKPR